MRAHTSPGLVVQLHAGNFLDVSLQQVLYIAVMEQVVANCIRFAGFLKPRQVVISNARLGPQRLVSGVVQCRGLSHASKLQDKVITRTPVTKEDIASYDDGTHPFLQKPLSTRHTEKLKINDCRAPHTGVIRLIALNELKSANALGRVLVQELADEIEAIHAEGSTGETRVVIFASEHDKTFCAGANLKERAEMSLDEANAFLLQLRTLFKRIDALPIPAIAAVHGNALGGGLELALSAHLRVFGSNALVGLPEGRLGIIPGAGGTYRLPRAIGMSRALDMILSARRVSGKDALTMGLCHYYAGTDYENHACGQEPNETRARIAVRQKALQLAAQIALCGPIASRAALEAIRGGSEEVENAAYEKVIKTDDRNEALQAFREKRPPAFKGS